MNTKAPILVLFLISCLTLTGQKVRLKGDTSRFLCKSDSLYHYFVKDLVDQDVDGMVTVQYDYDNGRVESAKTFILWMKDSLRQMKSFQGCDTIRDNGTLNFPVQKVFDLYRKYQVDTVTTRRIKSRLWVSHSMGYFVKVFLAGKTDKFRVTIFNLGDLEYSLENGTDEYVDPRSLFVDSMLKLIEERTASSTR